MIYRQCLPSPAQQPHTCGGNLAPTHAPSAGGHFLFEQQATKFCAQVRSGGQGFTSFSLTTARAAQKGVAPDDAKSLSPPSQYRTLKFVPCVVNEN